MHRIDSIERGAAIRLTIDGREVSAYAGETLATVLLLNGVVAFHRTKRGRPRAPFCNMGVCMECLVHVEDAGRVRACMTPVRDGMRVTTGVCFATRELESTEAHDAS
jgi:predicted molibdopterin-dependent oxidoreductase YjgC